MGRKWTEEERAARLDELKALAVSKGGKCLSTEYVSAFVKMNWECANGHTWAAHGSSILNNGTWCKYCSPTLKGTIEEMQALAVERFGECLSETYVNAITPLLWRCAKGHEWESTPQCVKNQGTWCKDCTGIKSYTLEDMKRMARERGGECLSTEYLDMNVKLEWTCRRKHVWKATPNTCVYRKSWCGKCARNSKQTIEDMQDLAATRGGRCLSLKYVDSKTAIEWECGQGHRWPATPAQVAYGTWCPHCPSGFRERVCRELMERVFGKRFVKIRLPWMVNSRGNVMESDGFCQELGLAFEHHGEQHYEFTSHYQETEAEFRQRQTDDDCKRHSCASNGVALFEIPFYVKLEDLEGFIHDIAESLGVRCPRVRGIDLGTLKAWKPAGGAGTASYTSGTIS